MMHLVLIVGTFFTLTASADRFVSYQGTAKENGALVYVEKHQLTFDDQNNILEATTSYVSPEGKVMGVMKSNFRKSLNLPDHVYRDERTQGQYGIRRENGRIVLFNQDAGKPEATKVLEEEKDQKRLQVGCQGLNYYLRGKINEMKDIKSLPVLLMIPGDLDSYQFKLDFVRENPDQTVDFKIKIENWFLRLFAPTLEFKFDPKVSRIVWYKGISNIKSDAGKNMNVEIEYQY
jgi:hypothetical protein